MKMSKSGSRVGVIFISLICLVATITVAQSIFSSSLQAPAAAAPATPPMSASDFKSRVSQMNQQSNAALQAQAQTLMKAAPLPPPPGAGAQTQTVAAPPSTSSSAAPAGSSSQVYTGFGGDSGAQPPANGSSGGTGSSSSGSSSGGSDWNIKY
jgi:hypothetical protein